MSAEQRRSLSAEIEAVRRDLEGIELPRGARARFDGRLQAGAGRRRARLVSWSLAGALLAAALLVVVALPRWPASDALVVRQQSADLETRARNEREVWVTRGSGEVAWEAEGVAIGVSAGSRLRLEGRAVRVVHGAAEIAVVARRPAGPPLRVLVSHGALEVLGTRFTVEQGDDGGSATVHAGVVRFVSDALPVRLVRAGETLSWPLDPRPAAAGVVPAQPPERPSAAAPAMPAKRRPRPRSAPEDSEALFAEIEDLRIRQQYGQLARRLEAALAAVEAPASRETFSAELCDVLVNHLDDAARACRCLTAHARAYANGRHDEQVRRWTVELGCRDE